MTTTICVYIPDMGTHQNQGFCTPHEVSPIVLYQCPEGSAPVEGKPQTAAVSAADGYRYQWYINDKERGNARTLELKAVDYRPGIHSLALVFRKDGRDLPTTRHLMFRVIRS
jgi:hypothetical protein